MKLNDINRCREICNTIMPTTCFTNDQKACLKDAIINNVFVISPIIDTLLEYEHIDETTKEMLLLIKTDVDHLIQWVKGL